MNKIKKFIKKFIYIIRSELGGRIRTGLAHFHEKRKYNDKRRVAIYKKISLTHEQKNQIDTLYGVNYGKKVPYIWHRHFMAFTGRFDAKYFPELLYIPEFEAYMNLNKAYNYVFSDKNILPFFTESAGVRIPKTILSCVKGIFRDNKNHIIDINDALKLLYDVGKVFIKPSVDSGSGKNCAMVNISSGIDLISEKTVEQIISNMGENFVVQELIVCHKSISDIYPNSVNTFRIITYLWKDKVNSVPTIMRIGRGGNFIDNAHAGGMFIAVEDDGTLHKTAFNEFKEEFDFHPDTKICYEGYKIELFPQVLLAAKRMHEMIPEIGVVNWDFTIDSEGKPVLIEINISGGSIWLPQMAHGKGAFGENTDEILRWMAHMRKTPISERHKYAYGKIK